MHWFLLSGGVHVNCSLTVYTQGGPDSPANGGGGERPHVVGGQLGLRSPQDCPPFHHLRWLLPGLQHQRGQRVWTRHLCLQVWAHTGLLLYLFAFRKTNSISTKTHAAFNSFGRMSLRQEEKWGQQETESSHRTLTGDNNSVLFFSFPLFWK